MLTAESRIREFDGLRGVAILAVVIFHLLVLPLDPFLSRSGIRDALTLLAYGVDLFFVISGFLIGTILLKIRGISGIKTFYIRRILRIWPLYYLLLFIVYVTLPDKGTFTETPYWSLFFFTFNFWQSFGKGIHEALGPLWSIAIEEQFYVLGPVIFSILNQKQISFFLVICVVLSPLLRLALLHNTDIDVWRFTPARIDGICLGLLLSIFLSSNKNVLFVVERSKYFSYLMFLLLISLIPSIILLPFNLWVSFGHSLIVLTFGCILLVVYIQCVSNKGVYFLNWGFLRYLGIRCYSIYLFHIFFRFIATAIYDNFYAHLITALVLILLFAHFSWRYIESPFIRLGKKFSYENTPK